MDDYITVEREPTVHELNDRLLNLQQQLSHLQQKLAELQTVMKLHHKKKK